jgi:hypothetical protein
MQRQSSASKHWFRVTGDDLGQEYLSKGVNVEEVVEPVLTVRAGIELAVGASV